MGLHAQFEKYLAKCVFLEKVYFRSKDYTLR